MIYLTAATDLKLFFGHFHPLVVHLPIGFLAALAVLELADRVKHFRHAAQARGVVLAMAAGSAVVAVVLGLMLASAGGYDRELLAYHKWSGIALATLCVGTALVYWRGRHRAYVGMLMLTLLVLGPASHFGGSMTHGRDYLTAYAPQWVRGMLGEKRVDVAAGAATRPAITDVSQARVFEDVVRPVLVKDCATCHGAGKMKGELRVDTVEGLMKGGKHGAAVVGGKVSDSLLVRRMQLPEEDEEHMPPAGKQQPTDEEMAVVQWWVEAGAPVGKRAGEMEVPVAVGDAMAKVLGLKVQGAEPALAWDAIAADVARVNEIHGIVATRMSPDSPWLNVNASPAAGAFGDEQVKVLAPIAPNVVWLDLAGTKVGDEGMGVVAGMANLQRLRLDRTGVTDAGVAKLGRLRKLDYLNLYGTKVTDAAVATLKGLPALRQVYLWKTRVTAEGSKALVDAKTDRAKVERLKRQLAELQAQIERQGVEVVGGVAAEGPTTKPTAVASTEPAKKEAGPVAVVNAAVAAPPAIINKVCPITGKPVDPTKFVEYKGKRIGFCCGDCPAEFQKDPAKYGEKVLLAAGGK